MLEARNINKTFGKNVIMKDFSFSIHPKQVVVLQGKSGSGKTTLLRIVNNLIETDGGDLQIDGVYLFKNGTYVSPAQQKEFQKKVGMVFQSFALFPHLTVMENIMAAPLYQKMDSRENLEEKAKEILNELDMIDKIDSMPSTLSGGQQQRVAIARAVMLRPKILCFDEPTSALDRDSIDSIIGIIQKLKERDMGIFVITHDEIFAEKVADKTISAKEFKEES